MRQKFNTSYVKRDIDKWTDDVLVGKNGSSAIPWMTMAQLSQAGFYYGPNSGLQFEVRFFQGKNTKQKFLAAEGWLNGTMKKIPAWLSKKTAMLAAKKMRENILKKRTGAALSEATPLILRGRVLFNPYFGIFKKSVSRINPKLRWHGLKTSTIFSSDRTPLHRPHSRGSGNDKFYGLKETKETSLKRPRNLVESIQVRKISTGRANDMFVAGIPGGYKSPDNGATFAKIALMQESGYTLSMSMYPRMRHFMIILAKLMGTNKFPGLDPNGKFVIPPRQIRPRTLKGGKESGGDESSSEVTVDLGGTVEAELRNDPLHLRVNRLLDRGSTSELAGLVAKAKAWEKRSNIDRGSRSANGYLAAKAFRILTRML